MYTNKETVYIKAITPVHVGAGQSLSSVDMPIQREKQTNIPKIEGSSLKGSIKHHIYHFKGFANIGEDKEKAKDYQKFERIFGAEEGDKDASLIGITDAKLLLFPMRSATDIFQLITCPFVLSRWEEETGEKIDEGILEEIENLEDEKCVIDSNEGKTTENTKVILEEYIFDPKPIDCSKLFESIPELNKLKQKIVILSDTAFIDMVTMYTEIITRNKIDMETGTAQGTALFTEEYLPAESVLYFHAFESPIYTGKADKDSIGTVLKYLNKGIEDVFQVGGNKTIGKGFVKNLAKQTQEKGVNQG